MTRRVAFIRPLRIPPIIATLSSGLVVLPAGLDDWWKSAIIRLTRR